MAEKVRYIVLTDVNPGHFPWAEKDDIQSLVRLFLYSNEIDIEEIILSSSCFLKRVGGKKAAKIVHRILDASDSKSPDGVPLSFRWLWYPESGTDKKTGFLSRDDTSFISVTFSSTGIYHLILRVKGARNLPLCRYRRIIFEVI